MNKIKFGRSHGVTKDMHNAQKHGLTGQDLFGIVPRAACVWGGRTLSHVSRYNPARARWYAEYTLARYIASMSGRSLIMGFTTSDVCHELKLMREPRHVAPLRFRLKQLKRERAIPI